MIELPILNFPEKFDFKFKKQSSKVTIFDEVRSKFLVLTPEEFVRQSLIKYFMIFEGYSSSAFILEQKIEINNTIKRLDILLMNKTTPEILVECKAPNIKINNKNFEQVARYNSQIKAKKILLSNGINHYMFLYDSILNTYTPTEFI